MSFSNHDRITSVSPTTAAGNSDSSSHDGQQHDTTAFSSSSSVRDDNDASPFQLSALIGGDQHHRSKRRLSTATLAQLAWVKQFAKSSFAADNGSPCTTTSSTIEEPNDDGMRSDSKRHDPFASSSQCAAENGPEDVALSPLSTYAPSQSVERVLLVSPDDISSGNNGHNLSSRCAPIASASLATSIAAVGMSHGPQNSNQNQKGDGGQSTSLPVKAIVLNEMLSTLLFNVFFDSETYARLAISNEEGRERALTLENAFVRTSVGELGRLAGALLDENSKLRRQLKFKAAAHARPREKEKKEQK